MPCVCIYLCVFVWGGSCSHRLLNEGYMCVCWVRRLGSGLVGPTSSMQCVAHGIRVGGREREWVKGGRMSFILTVEGIAKKFSFLLKKKTTNRQAHDQPGFLVGCGQRCPLPPPTAVAIHLFSPPLHLIPPLERVRCPGRQESPPGSSTPPGVLFLYVCLWLCGGGVAIPIGAHRVLLDAISSHLLDCLTLHSYGR